MDYNAKNNVSPEKHAEFIGWLCEQTVAALKAAQGDASALQASIQQFFQRATAANLDMEEIENILGINEPSILDLAQLGEEDEDIAISEFEKLSED